MHKAWLTGCSFAVAEETQSAEIIALLQNRHAMEELLHAEELPDAELSMRYMDSSEACICSINSAL